MSPAAIACSVDVETGALVDAKSHIQRLAFARVQGAQFRDQLFARCAVGGTHVDGVKVHMLAAAGTSNTGVDIGPAKNRQCLHWPDERDHFVAEQFQRGQHVRPRRLGRNRKGFGGAFAPIGIASEKLAERDYVADVFGFQIF